MENNFAELEVTVRQKQYEFIMLSETHVTSDIDDAEIELTDYHVFRCDSASKKTGGVVLYVYKFWQVTLIQTTNIAMDIW